MVNINMSKIISNKIIEKNGVQYIGSQDFDYNDGNKSEEYILSVINSTNDISSDSRELEKYIIDWSSKYHLSSERANCYRSMSLPKDSIILEIGSGCGSITRYLAENVGTVVALEGSPRRAKITHRRTRDLENVIVICGSFEEVLFKYKFDYVICNGVLEYASLFSSSDNPIEDFLKSMSKLLNDSGSVIIAIENKLGLRYFSSGCEEHTGIMFDGLEDYPRFKRGARTFGKRELSDLLNRDFDSVELFIPLPDYKLPSGIIRETLTSQVDCGELFAATDRYDFGSSMAPLMHERLVWNSIEKTGLLSDFSNSFLFVAGPTISKLFKEDWLGDIYSGNRRPEYMTRTRILKSSDGDITTKKNRLFNNDLFNDKLLSHAEITEKWKNGVSIHTLISRVFMEKNKGGLGEKLTEPVSIWWGLLDGNIDDNQKLDGVCIDNIWQNCIYNNKASFIDSEWVWSDRIPALLLIYRSVIGFVSKDIGFLYRWKSSNRLLPQIYIIKTVADICNIEFSLKLLVSAIKLDLKFSKASQDKSPIFFISLIRLFIPMNILRAKVLLTSFLARNISRIKNRLP
jgi:SAM-dependent methyltransferase